MYSTCFTALRKVVLRLDNALPIVFFRIIAPEKGGSMPRLAVNVDHVATLREARKTSYPDPVSMAAMAEFAGADAIVVHLREDRRHIQDRDVRILKKTVQTRLILEMGATDAMLDFSLDVGPDTVTLVPERREEITTEGGLDVVANMETVEKALSRLKNAGIHTCLFIDPDLAQVEAARAAGAESVELHTGTFCELKNEPGKQKKAMQDLVRAAKRAKDLDMGANAGHGICYHSIKEFRGFKEIDEFSIGHSIVSMAVACGMEEAVRRMLHLIREL